MNLQIADWQWVEFGLIGAGDCTCRYVHTVDGIGYRNPSPVCCVRHPPGRETTDPCCYVVNLSTGGLGHTVEHHCPLPTAAHPGPIYRTPQRYS